MFANLRTRIFVLIIRKFNRTVPQEKTRMQEESFFNNSLNMSKKDRNVDQQAEDQRGQAVGGEEGCVQAAQIGRGDDGVLPDEHGQEEDARGDAPGVGQARLDQK